MRSALRSASITATPAAPYRSATGTLNSSTRFCEGWTSGADLSCLAPLAGRGRRAFRAAGEGAPVSPHRQHLRVGEPLTPTLQERASLVSTPQAGRGRKERSLHHPRRFAFAAIDSRVRCAIAAASG